MSIRSVLLQKKTLAPKSLTVM